MRVWPSPGAAPAWGPRPSIAPLQQAEAAGLIFEVFEAPLRYVGGEHERINQAAAEGGAGRRGLGEALAEIPPERGGYPAGGRGVDVAVELQVPEQHLPVLAHVGEQTIPIERGAAAVDQVADVTAVEALAPGDEDLAEDHLFGGEQADAGRPQHLARACPIDPLGSDPKYAVGHAADQVHVVVAGPGLGQPNRVGDLGDQTGGAAEGEGDIDFFGGEKQIEVFGESPDPGVVLEGEGASHGKAHAAAREGAEHALEKLALLGHQGRPRNRTPTGRPGRRVGQRRHSLYPDDAPGYRRCSPDRGRTRPRPQLSLWRLAGGDAGPGRDAGAAGSGVLVGRRRAAGGRAGAAVAAALGGDGGGDGGADCGG